MAIAFDASSSGTGNPIPAITHTCTGSNLLLLAGIRSQSNTTTASYNSVAMTRIGSAFNVGGTDWDHFFYLLGPSTGANSLTFANLGAGSSWAAAASYTGVSQSGQPDSSSSNNGSSTTPSASTTTIADNSWIMCWGDNEVDTLTASTNTSLRIQSPSTAMGIYEYSSNPKTPAGSQTLNFTLTVSGAWYINIASFSPAGGGGGGGAVPAFNLNLLGAGQ